MKIPLIGLAVLLSACAAGNSANVDSFGLDFDVDPDDVMPGDSITLELENDNSTPVSYNLCSSTLEMQRGNEWSGVTEDRMCTRELRILAPGEEAHFRLQLPQTLEAGRYRFTTAVQLEEGSRTEQIPSETFEVELR